MAQKNSLKHRKYECLNYRCNKYNKIRVVLTVALLFRNTIIYHVAFVPVCKPYIPVVY